MFIKKLRLNNFRNYVDETFEFTDGINVLCGDNAQGKTNSGEAIFYLCTGYSPRATKEKQIIRYGEDRAYIEGLAQSAYGEVNVRIDFYSGDKKSAKINGVETQKIGDILGNIHSVFFNPSDLKLIQESPEDRRRFLDISLSQISKNYFIALSRYKKILLQRNNLLKEEDKDLIKETLPIWDEQLASSGAEIIKRRYEYVSVLQPYAKNAYSFITDGKENIEIEFEHKYDGGIEDIKEQLLRDYAERLEKDIILGYTGVGPHRDDLRIKVDGNDVKLYGSQGQQRTCALSMKLAETEIFKDYFGEYPVLILDDAMSELDKSRQKRLLEKLNGIQTVITCTDVDQEVFGGVNYKKYVVKQGQLVR